MRKRKWIIWLIVIIMLLTLADAVCTASGIRMGVITEGNPILETAATSAPIWTGIAAVIYTASLMVVVYYFGRRCRCTVPLLAGLCVVKVCVMGLHVGWMLLI